MKVDAFMATVNSKSETVALSGRSKADRTVLVRRTNVNATLYQDRNINNRRTRIFSGQ